MGASQSKTQQQQGEPVIFYNPNVPLQVFSISKQM